MYRRLVALLLFVASLGSTANAADRFQVFFLAAGSTYYLQPKEPGLHGFAQLSGANSSARLVAELLSKHGAIAGATLVSQPDRFLSKQDFQSALKSVVAQISERRAKNPLLVVYYAGHGVSEGVAWNHFSVPGNFVYGAPLDRLDIEAVASHTINAGLLAEELDRLKIPYVLLLDSCYEGDPKSFESPVLGSTAIQNITAVAAILRFQNEFHTPDPVIFSAEPGKRVPLAPDPREPLTKSLAPIARRLLLLDERISASGSDLSLSALVKTLTSPNLDAETTPPVTHATPPAHDGVVLARSAIAPAEILTLAATATTPDRCCEHSPANEPTKSAAKRRMSGSLVFEGPPGEYVSGGKRVTLADPGTFIKVVERDAQSVELTFDGSDDWELDLAAPTSQTLGVKRYRAAQRYPFQDDRRPGLALTGAGHACNTVSGEFTVTRLDRDQAGRLKELVAQFVQRCEGQTQSLRGTVQVHTD